jgi:hypothetical protein
MLVHNPWREKQEGDPMNFQSQFVEQRSGFWVPPDCEKETLSYPEEGNELCYRLEESSFWFLHRNRVLSQLLKMWKPSGPFIDVGGGNGFVAKGLQEDGVEAIVLEPGLQGALNAHQRGLQVIHASLDDKLFPDQSVSAFGLCDVLEHIEKDQDFLHLLSAKLAPHGYAFITVPALQWLWSFEDEFAGHFRRYTTHSLSQKVAQAGLHVRYCSYFFSFLPLPIFFLRSLPTKLGTRKALDMNKVTGEHTPPSQGLSKRILDALLQRELKLINQNRRMFWGSSIVLVAEKV